MTETDILIPLATCLIVIGALLLVYLSCTLLRWSAESSREERRKKGTAKRTPFSSPQRRPQRATNPTGAPQNRRQTDRSERAYYGWQLPEWTTAGKSPSYGDGKLVFESMIDYVTRKF